jgi:hypothetical protein
MGHEPRKSTGCKQKEGVKNVHRRIQGGKHGFRMGLSSINVSRLMSLPIIANQQALQCSKNYVKKHQAGYVGHKSRFNYKMQERKDITFDHRPNPGTQAWVSNGATSMFGSPFVEAPVPAKFGAVPQHYNENHLGKWVANQGLNAGFHAQGKTSYMIHHEYRNWKAWVSNRIE